MLTSWRYARYAPRIAAPIVGEATQRQKADALAHAALAMGESTKVPRPSADIQDMENLIKYILGGAVGYAIMFVVLFVIVFWPF